MVSRIECVEGVRKSGEIGARPRTRVVLRTRVAGTTFIARGMHQGPLGRRKMPRSEGHEMHGPIAMQLPDLPAAPRLGTEVET